MLVICWACWTDRQERRYQRFAALWRSGPVNWVWDRLPMAVRYNGVARRAYAREGVRPWTDARAGMILDAALAEFEQHGVRRVATDERRAAGGGQLHHHLPVLRRA